MTCSSCSIPEFVKIISQPTVPIWSWESWIPSSAPLGGEVTRSKSVLKYQRSTKHVPSAVLLEHPHCTTSKIIKFSTSFHPESSHPAQPHLWWNKGLTWEVDSSASQELWTSRQFHIQSLLHIMKFQPVPSLSQHNDFEAKGIPWITSSENLQLSSFNHETCTKEHACVLKWSNSSKLHPASTSTRRSSTKTGVLDTPHKSVGSEASKWLALPPRPRTTWLHDPG